MCRCAMFHLFYTTHLHKERPVFEGDQLISEHGLMLNLSKTKVMVSGRGKCFEEFSQDAVIG